MPARSSLVATLSDIAQRHGTPLYAYDIGCVDQQVRRLRAELPPSVRIFYSVKANPSLCSILAERGLGADASSPGELDAVLRAGFSHDNVCVTGPYKSKAMLRLLDSIPSVMISVDSLHELWTLDQIHQPNPLLLRLRPNGVAGDCTSAEFRARFGITLPEVRKHRDAIASSALNLVGFHVFAGSQLMGGPALVRYLHGALEVSLDVADMIGLAPDVLNLGGGFGVPYSRGEAELDISFVGQQLSVLVERAGTASIVLELGRYISAQAGWYLTSVVGYQTHDGRRAVVVDGGIHQRFDLCRLGTRSSAPAPLVLRSEGLGGRYPHEDNEPRAATDVLGCLCLPDDILSEGAELPDLQIGDVLAFPNSGAYGLTASPLTFLGHPPPAEVIFERDSTNTVDRRIPS